MQVFSLPLILGPADPPTFLVFEKHECQKLIQKRSMDSYLAKMLFLQEDDDF